MEKKYSIGFGVIVILFVLVLIVANKAGYSYMQKKSIEVIEETEKITVTTQGNASKEEIYYLAELNGYVVVYCEDKSTIYEYTNILVEELPTEVQTELENWKQIEGIQQLYGFLENYSS